MDSTYGQEEKENIFEVVEKSRVFPSEAKEFIQVDYTRFHRYAQFDEIDSLWTFLIDHEEEIGEFRAEQPEKSENENGWHMMDVMYKDTASMQAVKARYLYKKDKLYELKTLVDSSAPSTDFVNQFYNSFTPGEDQTGISVFEDKTELFFQDIKSEADSIQYSAWESIQVVHFKESDFALLVELLESEGKKEDYEKYDSDLVDAIGSLGTEKAFNYLTTLYKNRKGESDLQMTILENLASYKSEWAYSAIISMLEYDLPLPSNNYSITNLFHNLGEENQFTGKQIDDLLQFYTIQEYKKGILSILSSVLDQETKKRQRKAIKKPLLTNAKLELKRIKSDMAKNEHTTYRSSASYKFRKLEPYLSILYHFRKDSDVKEFFNELRELDHPQAALLLAGTTMANGDSLSEKYLHQLSAETSSLFNLYDLLYEYEQSDALSDISEKEIVDSYLYSKGKLKQEKDSVIYLEKKDIFNQYDEKNYRIYFYKIKDEGDSYTAPAWTLAYVGFALDENGNMIPDSVLFEHGKEYFDEKGLKQQKDVGIDRLLHDHRRRATFRTPGQYYYGASGY